MYMLTFYESGLVYWMSRPMDLTAMVIGSVVWDLFL